MEVFIHRRGWGWPDSEDILMWAGEGEAWGILYLVLERGKLPVIRDSQAGILSRV